jgi:hypothetical protein
MLGAADEDLGLDAEAGQLAHAVLGGLGLELAGGGDVGTRVVWIDRVSAARPLVPELANRLDEGSDSMSPTVPPISQMTNRVGSRSAAMNSLIALVTCGTTWTVAPR